MLPPPEKLWSISTGEEMPGTQLNNTMDSGAIVESRQGGQHPGENIDRGDVILAVDGFRIYGSREFQIARFRNPLSKTMDLLVNRKGDLHAIRLHDLPPGRGLNLHFDTTAEQDRILAAVESTGVALLDEKVRAALRGLPEEAASQLATWSSAATQKEDTAWLTDFVTLYTTVHDRQYANAKQPQHEPPVEYFKRLEKFYLYLADRNGSKETAPDLKSSGETPEFYALAVPIPSYVSPLGDAKFPDRRFTALLIRRHEIGFKDDPELSAAAMSYVTSGTDTLEQYVGQIKAALLDPEQQGGWPFRSSLLGTKPARILLENDLADRTRDPNDPDWALHQYGLIMIKYLTGAHTQAANLLVDLGKKSPYLARCAAESLFDARRLRKAPWKSLRPTENRLSQNKDFLGETAPAIYLWALDKVHPLAVSLQLVAGVEFPSPQHVLAEAPYAMAQALKGIQPAPTPAQEDTADADGGDDQ